MAGHSYVKAVYDFSTTQQDELAFNAGDVILLLYKVDDNWSCGKLYGQVL